MASKFAPCLLLTASLAGCAGNVIEGLPREGGVEPDPTAQTEDAGVGTTRDASVARDAAVSGSSDSGSNSTTQDASTPAQNDSGAAMMPGNDAGASSGTALNPGLLARPTNNGRKYTATLSDWQGTPRCSEGTAQNQVTFCDDFESGTTPGSAWTTLGSNVSLSTAQKMRGSQAMLTAPPAGQFGQVQETKTASTLQTKMFGRVFVYFSTDLPTTPDFALFTLVQAGDTGSDKTEVRLTGQMDPARGGKSFFGIGSNGGSTGDWNTQGREPESEIKKGVWTCLEWMFDGGANETRVWINNVEQLSLHTTASNYKVGNDESGNFDHPPYNYVRIGYWGYQAATQPSPSQVYLDELALDDDQIGCSL